MTSRTEDALVVLLNIDAEIRHLRSWLDVSENCAGRSLARSGEGLAALQEQLRTAQMRREEQFITLHLLAKFLR